MLLPTPSKTYKDLEDVDEALPEEQMKTSKGPPKPEMQGRIKDNNTLSDTESHSSTSRDDNVSPELQEQEIWYTQPIDEVFMNQENDACKEPTSKLRLYKRDSYPDLDSETDCQLATSAAFSETSSPSAVKPRTRSFASDTGSEVLEESVLIPAWLTEVISTDESGDEEINLASSLKSSSPFPTELNTTSMSMTEHNDSLERVKTVWNQEIVLSSANSPFTVSPTALRDDNSTPTPSDCEQVSVSLVDLDYMSRFLGGDATPEWDSLTPKGGFSLPDPLSLPALSQLWQSQVLVDYTLDTDIWQTSWFPCPPVFDLHFWHPLGSSPYSQLWDVNMQKRAKVSPGGDPWRSADAHIWFTENTLVLLCNTGSEQEGDVTGSENTLIPQISIDTAACPDTEIAVFDNDNGSMDFYERATSFDRSLSMDESIVPWDHEMAVAREDSKLSKSFELVPSEHSAFNDVPRKLLHVHSEPNLLQFRHNMGDSGIDQLQSPQEPLYLSPKTHFRPITPAYAPELLLSASKSKHLVCHDLFGGMPATKTPTQQFLVEDTAASDEETFVPSFKLKHSSKCVQTGDSFDKVESPRCQCEQEVREPPETLTLSMIEDLMGENDSADRFEHMFDDLDAANTDSAYETDYGGNPGQEQDSERQYKGQNHGFAHGDLAAFDTGDVIDYKVESFLATYPHTQDWPDAASIPRDLWAETAPSDTWATAHTIHTDQRPEGEKPVPTIAGTANSGFWKEEVVGGEQIYPEDLDKYRNIWSTAGQEYYTMDGLDVEGFHDDPFPIFADEECDNNSPNVSCYTLADALACDLNLAQENFLGAFSEFKKGQDYIRNETSDPDPCVPGSVCEDDELPPPDTDTQLQQSAKLTPDFYSVRLIYRNKQQQRNNSDEVCDSINLHI